MRYYLRVWEENGCLCCTDIVPEQVAVTIKAAVNNGLRHGTVIHDRTYRGIEGSDREYYCWSLV